jgi:hypothetical protein
MIKVEVTVNGYVTIDAAHGDALLLGIYPFASGSDDKLLRIARAFAPNATTLARMSFRKKTGVSNMGWRAVFIDKDKQEAYVKRHALLGDGS